MIEDIFIDDLRIRGVEVTRNSPFISCSMAKSKTTVDITCNDLSTGNIKTLHSKYVVGCDGAHSNVRKSIPGIEMVGESGKAAWGVLDGVVDTDFPDIWSKVAIHSETEGSILCIPRERNMTRLYIELHPGTTSDLPQEVANEDFVIRRAQAILAPYKLSYKSIEWFSVYRVGQRVASAFTDPTDHIFITGDAAHTHSPKAAQGMNVSMHDSFNLAWKLNLAVRGLAKPALLATYAAERRQIAQQLIDFDREHADAFHAGDAAALAKNFDDNIRFISGVGAEYAPNVLNFGYSDVASRSARGDLKPGALLSPARISRYIDANPVDIQLDIPMLGQFRLYFFVRNVHTALPFLDDLCAFLASTDSVLGRASRAADASYAAMAPVPLPELENFAQTDRYTQASKLVTFALVADMDKSAVEIAQLPDALARCRWSFYLDDVLGDGGCTRKYLGGLEDGETGIVCVRPDGYVGALEYFKIEEVAKARDWVDRYFGGFLVG